ncbi:hypothetical protein CAL27_06225 [Bordetella genomosp. 1]|uniref:Cellobiose phosphorylase n=2 Tax=Bordetella genomosp. 1 TaxID=1395607 RepID=A0ABX4F5M1_9BORD|nr:hypothetical protein CAL27_06225 [Bordetella genomosp. 1]
MDIQETDFFGRRIAVCGDDFGMNHAVDGAMLQLVDLGRMSAVSCLATGPAFAAHAAELQRRDVDIGLHLNLTESLCAADGEMPALRTLLVRAWRGQLEPGWVEGQIARQLDAFEAHMGRAPDYVDGHQHVHQFPGVLQPLLRQLRQRYGLYRPWLRNTAPGLLAGVPLADAAKARFIGLLGSRALCAAAQTEGWRTNRRLLGVYGLEGGARAYADRLHCWLFNAADGDLLMCHPALPGRDPMAHARQRAAEFEVLRNTELSGWMGANGLAVRRLSQLGALRDTAESVNFDAVAPAGRLRHLVSRS